jgi:uncharacterized protein YecE (DUF72 family)
MRIRTGMSGYAYPEWKGSFYPGDLAPDRMLAWYATRFDTVEINNTFYRLPKESVLLDWASQVPGGFTFSIKASRRITHDQGLRDTASLMDFLLRNVSALGDRRGPTLFQLPPGLKKDVELLREFLTLVPQRWQAAFEWRHPSWHDDQVYDLLRARNAAVVVSDSARGAGPLVATASWGYLRLHRPGYSDADLGGWIDRIREQPWEEALVYFKHEEEIAGPAVGLRFRELCER